MKAISIIYRFMTQTEFKAINNLIQSSGGGSQTYIDFPKGSVKDSDWIDFLGNQGEEAPNGYKWHINVKSLSLGDVEQDVELSCRRENTNSLREQNNNRIKIWSPKYSSFPSASDIYDEENPLCIYLLKDTEGEIWAGWFYPNTCNNVWFMNIELASIFFNKGKGAAGYIKFKDPIHFDENNYNWPFYKSFTNNNATSSEEVKEDDQILNALRTKPFLLLAGISGTGKSRKVQELAYLTCKRDGIHDADPTAPGNYLLIPVKPNWHDSTELLGYYSSLTGKYVLTDFIRFVWKAWTNKKVPYFLCLDEMNLAPVEQYFAEYLSILETRKLIRNEKTGEWEIQSAELLSKKIFEGIDAYAKISINNKDDDGVRVKEEPIYKGEDIQIINFLKENGLRLPENLFVIGTVNMDDTTHQFSRKVIDRAFTIEMNGDELSKMFDARDSLTYQTHPKELDEIKPLFIKAKEVLDFYPNDAIIIKEEVPKMLNKINGEGILKDTPFRVSYRVQNELILYYAAIRPHGELNEDQIIPYLQESFMAVLLEKVLPRVEGDEKALRCKEDGYSEILNNLKKYICELNPDEAVRSEICKTLIAKLNEMNERVKNSYFTSFFS